MHVDPDHDTGPRLTDGEVKALHAQALGLMRLGRPEAAAEILLSLTLARPTDARLYRDLGLAWQHAQWYPRALLAYEAAVALAPMDASAAALRAECMLHVVPVREAWAALAHVLTLPTTVEAAPYLARARQLHHMLAQHPEVTQP